MSIHFGGIEKMPTDVLLRMFIEFQKEIAYRARMAECDGDLPAPNRAVKLMAEVTAVGLAYLSKDMQDAQKYREAFFAYLDVVYNKDYFRAGIEARADEQRAKNTMDAALKKAMGESK